jgi:GNAT superfamily N-acetyltransferase
MHTLLAAPAPLRAWVNPALRPAGCIGAPTGPDPLAEIAAAEAWLRAQGCTIALGPLDGATWYPYRAVLGPDERPPFLGEPRASPVPWREAGYAPAARYASALADNAAQAASAAARGAALAAAGWTLEAMDRAPSAEAWIDTFWELSVASFQGAFCFSPIAREDFAGLYLPLLPRLLPALVLLCRDPTGAPVGFCLCMPDLLQPGRREFIVKSLAVLPEARRAGAGSWLVGHAHAVAESLGFTGGGIHALMWSDSRSRAISAHGGRVFREYALYARELGPA